MLSFLYHSDARQEMPLFNQAQREALEWFTRLQDDVVVSAQTQAGFNHWCKQDPQHAAAYESILQFWESPAFAQALVKADALLCDA